MISRPDKVERAIQLRLTELARAWKETSRSYSVPYCTRQLKRAIGAQGRERGYAVHTAAPGFRQLGEWLFDITWLAVAGQQVLEIPLAAEIEWTPGNETLWDFQKLLVSRARHRVLVMWTRTNQKAARIIDGLIQQVSRFKQNRRGDRYLFACYLMDSEKFIFRVHVVSRPA